MADIRDLLQTAARQSRSAPDLAQIQRRSQFLRRRDQATRSAAVLAVAAIVVPLALILTGGDTDRLHEVPATSPTPTPSTTSSSSPSTPGPAVTVPPQGAGLAAPNASIPAEPETPGLNPQPTTSNSPRPGNPQQSPPPGYPAAASCHVNTNNLAPGQQRSCRFRATDPGGWRYRSSGGAGAGGGPEAHVTVIRNGQTYVDPGDTGARCANGAILPGDLVEVTIRQENAGYIIADMGAGLGYACGTN